MQLLTLFKNLLLFLYLAVDGECSCETGNTCSDDVIADIHYSSTDIVSTGNRNNDVIPEDRFDAIVAARCRAGNAASLRDPHRRRADLAVLSAFRGALEALQDRLPSKNARDTVELTASVRAVQRRLEFHARRALGGVRRVFMGWFGDEYGRLRDRVIEPLVDGGMELVARIEQTVKQLSFTPSSEVVARKVRMFIYVKHKHPMSIDKSVWFYLLCRTFLQFGQV